MNEKLTSMGRGFAVAWPVLFRVRAVILIGLLAVTASIQAKEQVPLKGAFQTFHQDTFGFNPVVGPVVMVTVEGSGHAAHLGRTTVSTDNQIGHLASGFLGATYTLTAANGDTLVLRLEGTASIDVATQSAAFSGDYVVLGGTGRFTDATGFGTFSGWAVFEEPFGLPTNHGPGYFEIDGVISSVGAGAR